MQSYDFTKFQKQTPGSLLAWDNIRVYHVLLHNFSLIFFRVNHNEIIMQYYVLIVGTLAAQYLTSLALINSTYEDQPISGNGIL